MTATKLHYLFQNVSVIIVMVQVSGVLQLKPNSQSKIKFIFTKHFFKTTVIFIYLFIILNKITMVSWYCVYIETATIFSLILTQNLAGAIASVIMHASYMKDNFSTHFFLIHNYNLVIISFSSHHYTFHACL